MPSSNKPLTPFRCAFCPAMVPNFHVYMKHVSAVHPDSGAYLCDSCRIACSSFTNLTDHQRKVHGVDAEPSIRKTEGNLFA